MNENILDASDAQIKNRAENVGRQIAEILKNDYDVDLNRLIKLYKDDDIEDFAQKVAYNIPYSLKDRFFNNISQDEIDRFVKNIKRDHANGNSIYRNSEILINICKSNDRRKFIDGLFNLIIYNSITIETYTDGSIEWDSYYAYSDFGDGEIDINNADDTVLMILYYCFNICETCGNELITETATKFKITTNWYFPKTRTDIIEAKNKKDAEQIINNKYQHYINTHSEDQELYKGILDIEKI